MTFDEISDIHENFYVPLLFKTQKDFINTIFKDHIFGDYLIIAGDLSETVSRVKSFLENLEEETPYKKIFYVPGNHDLYEEVGLLYLEDKYEALKEAIKPLKKAEFLDGEIHEIEGIKLSGLGMFYDTAYLESRQPHLGKHAISGEFMNLWFNFMLDSRKTNSDPLHFSALQKEKLEKIAGNVELFISHVTPVYIDRYFNEKYRGSITNTFFSFDGLKYLEKGNIKYWVYGHTHDPFEGEIYNTKLICNPLGYPGENSKIKIKKIIF